MLRMEKNPEPTKPLRKGLITLRKYYRRYRRYFIVGFLVVVATNVFTALWPWLLREAIDSLDGRTLSSLQGFGVYATLKEAALPAALYSLPWYAAAMIVVAIIAGVFRFLSRRSIIWASRFIEYDLRNEVFGHLLKLSASFYQRTPTGDIIARLSNDLEAIRLMAGPAVMYMMNTISMGVVSLTAMFLISPRLALFSLIPLPLLSLAMWRVGKETHKRFMRVQDHYSVMSAFVQETMAGIRVLKAYCREEHREEQFGGVNRKYVDLNLSLARVRAIFVPIIMFLVGAGGLVVLWVGGMGVINQTISKGDFIAFQVYLMMLIWPMLAIGWVINLYQRGMASMKRVDALLNEQPDVLDPTNPLTVAGPGGIRIENLSFRYPQSNVDVLKEVSLQVKPGEMLAIVGSTGAGKSTLVSLLMRTYPLPDNAILIDDTDINCLPLDDLRTMIGFVRQDPYLFCDTIAANIAFSQAQVDSTEVAEAARLAAFDSEVESFPRKYETILGERGITLSGGQKQRAAIARALLKRPKILVLDDAFSSVDTQTEEYILDNLNALGFRPTTILVSHRPSTIRRADRVVVLHEGKVVESGTHEELMRRQGRYYDIIRREELAGELEMLN